jgi:hypothetical protein
MLFLAALLSTLVHVLLVARRSAGMVKRGDERRGAGDAASVWSGPVHAEKEKP